jgi:hypothetical protein
VKRITKKDIWDVSECDITCTKCGTTFWNGRPCKCNVSDSNHLFVSVVLLREVLKELEKVEVKGSDGWTYVPKGFISEAFPGVLEDG